MLNELITFTLLSRACAAVSITATKAVITRPIRVWVGSKSKFLGELWECPYCFSHWVALIFTIIYRPTLVSCGVMTFDILITAFAMTGVSAVFCGLIMRAYEEE